MIFKWFTITLTVVFLLYLVRGQFVPENGCSQYFQYVNNGGGSFDGEVTLPTLVQGRNRIDLRFSQQGQQNQGVVGGVMPYPDERTVRKNVANPKFRVALQADAVTGLLPKLTRFAFNDASYCTASEYAPPNSYFNRFYELHVIGNIKPQQVTSSVFSPFARDQTDVSLQTLFFDQTGQLPWQRVPTVGTSSNNDLPVNWQPWEITPNSVTVTRAPLSPLPPAPKFRPVVAVTPTTTTTTPRPTAPPQSPQTPPPRRPESTPPRVFEPSFTTSSTNNFNPTAFTECGIQGTLAPFIINGKEYPRGQYPWLTAVYHKEHLSLGFKCGGSLISNNMVITAAHCVYKMREDRVLVAVGRYDLDDYIETGVERREIKHILVHPDYSTRVMADADLAMLTMHKPVEFNDIISPICLWTERESQTVATKGFVAGWGKDEDGNAMTQFPRVAEAKIVTLTECLSSWVAVQRISPRTLCAGNKDGSGPCIGDSGGGLMVMRNNRWLLRGVVSLGERGTNGQCDLNQYVLYCDLSQHVSWINENLR